MAGFSEAEGAFPMVTVKKDNVWVDLSGMLNLFCIRSQKQQNGSFTLFT